jgi:hypothetical protein
VNGLETLIWEGQPAGKRSETSTQLESRDPKQLLAFENVIWAEATALGALIRQRQMVDAPKYFNGDKID